jgi:hypothetical protein
MNGPLSPTTARGRPGARRGGRRRATARLPPCSLRRDRPRPPARPEPRVAPANTAEPRERRLGSPCLPPVSGCRRCSTWFRAGRCSTCCPAPAPGGSSCSARPRKRQDGPAALVVRVPPRTRPRRLGVGRARRGGRAALLALGRQCAGRGGPREGVGRARRRGAGIPRRGRGRTAALGTRRSRGAGGPGDRRPARAPRAGHSGRASGTAAPARSKLLRPDPGMPFLGGRKAPVDLGQPLVVLELRQRAVPAPLCRSRPASWRGTGARPFWPPHLHRRRRLWPRGAHPARV